MRVTIKEILCLISVLFLIFACCSESYALGQMIEDADLFLGKGKEVSEVINTTSLQSTSSFIFKAFYTVGIIVAVIVGVIIGVKFIYESAEGQAKLKEAFIPYVVGCVIVFSAYPIWEMIINFGNEQGFIKETMTEEEALNVYNDVRAKIMGSNYEAITPDDYKGAWTYIKNAYESKTTDEIRIVYLGYIGQCDEERLVDSTVVGPVYVGYMEHFLKLSEHECNEKYSQFYTMAGGYINTTEPWIATWRYLANIRE